MSKYWSDAIQALTPYIPGEQTSLPDVIKLNTNENPYPPSPEVAKVIANFNTEQLKLYPDPDSTELKITLAKEFSLKQEQLFVGNGSDEVLAHVFAAFFRKSLPILLPEHTYSFYPVYCQLYGIEFKEIPLTKDFQLHIADYNLENGGIIFANPNAPTGRYIELDEIKSLLERNAESVVVVDEAYIDFGGSSAIELISSFPNLLVVQTLSKSRSLAGLRVGFAAGDANLIAGLERVKNSFNSYPLDRLAIKAAIAAINDTEYFNATCKKVIATREWTSNKLAELGFISLPSMANFLFSSHRYIEAAELMGYLRSRNILVRHFSKPAIDNYLRISIGTDWQMQQLITALAQHPDIIKM